MTKRLLAAMTALIMCASAAGCGKTEEEVAESKADSKTSAAAAEDSSAAEAEKSADSEDSSEESSAAEKDDDSADEKEEKPDKEDTPTAGSSGLDPKNIIYTDYGSNDTPTDEEAVQFVSLAMEQYQAAYEGDAQKYFDLINFDVLIDPMADMMEKMIDDDADDSDFSSAKYSAIVRGLYTMLFMAGTDHMDDFEWHDSKEDYARRVRAAVQNIDVNSDDAWETLGYIFEEVQELEPWGGADGNTIVGMEIYACDREGDDLYITFDLGVLSGDKVFLLDAVSGWRVKGEWGVCFSGADMDDNEYEGMTADEIRESLEKEETGKEANSVAKSLYNAVAEYIADNETMGIDPDTAVKNGLPKLSAGGLDMALGEPAAEGDRIIYEEMKWLGYDGIFRISGDYSAYSFYAYYTAPDGTQGQYPVF